MRATDYLQITSDEQIWSGRKAEAVGTFLSGDPVIRKEGKMMDDALKAFHKDIHFYQYL